MSHDPAVRPSNAHATSASPRIPSTQRRSARKDARPSATIDELASSTGAGPGQLDAFDAAVQASHAAVGAANHAIFGDPLPAVQRRAGNARAAATSDEVHAVAARGVAGSGARLPHREAIQASFGRHDVARIEAHLGGDATSANHAIGANAYASGNHVAFASAPSLHTAAHEAAHVVQQRGGVQLEGGVGAVGDTYERHADAVADRVVRGEPAEDLLDLHAGPGVQGQTTQRQAAAGGHGARLDDAVKEATYDRLFVSLGPWAVAATITGVRVNGNLATGGSLRGPSIASAMLGGASFTDLDDLILFQRLVLGVGTAFMTWVSSVAVVDQLWYPGLEAVSAPVTRPTANAPVSLSSLVMAMRPMSIGGLEEAMTRALADRLTPDMAPQLRSLAERIASSFMVWTNATMITNCVATGAVPTFAPPAVRAGPVVGTATMLPGGLVAPTFTGRVGGAAAPGVGIGNGGQPVDAPVQREASSTSAAAPPPSPTSAAVAASAPTPTRAPAAAAATTVAEGAARAAPSRSPEEQAAAQAVTQHRLASVSNADIVAWARALDRAYMGEPQGTPHRSELARLLVQLYTELDGRIRRAATGQSRRASPDQAMEHPRLEGITWSGGPLTGLIEDIAPFASLDLWVGDAHVPAPVRRPRPRPRPSAAEMTFPDEVVRPERPPAPTAPVPDGAMELGRIPELNYRDPNAERLENVGRVIEFGGGIASPLLELAVLPAAELLATEAAMFALGFFGNFAALLATWMGADAAAHATDRGLGFHDGVLDLARPYGYPSLERQPLSAWPAMPSIRSAGAPGGRSEDAAGQQGLIEGLERARRWVMEPRSIVREGRSVAIEPRVFLHMLVRHHHGHEGLRQELNRRVNAELRRGGRPAIFFESN